MSRTVWLVLVLLYSLACPVTVSATAFPTAVDTLAVQLGTTLSSPVKPLIGGSTYRGHATAVERCPLNCFVASHSLATVPYFSRDQARSVALVYRGDRVAPRPIVPIEVQHRGTGTPPQRWWMEIRTAAGPVTFVNGETRMYFTGPTGNEWRRLTGQFDANANGVGSGAHWINIVVAADFGGTVLDTAVVTPVLVVNDESSPIARGWNLAMEQRLYFPTDNSILVAEGTGSVFHHFASGGQFVAPHGDRTQIVMATVDGAAGYERRYLDGTVVQFLGNGRMRRITDRFGAATVLGRDGAQRVTTITDPQGLVTTLVYDANGLDYIQDPMNRRTEVTVNASRALVTWQDPDNIATTMGYDGSQRLQSVTDRLGHTTTMAYGSAGLLSTVTAPAVAVHGAGNQSPVTTFQPWQHFGLPTSSTASTPWPSPFLDSVRARVIEPGGAASWWTVAWWGMPVQQVNALGHTSWSWYQLGGEQIWGAAAHYLPGESDSVFYNAVGLPTWTRTTGRPATVVNYDATRFWAVDTVRGPGQPVQAFQVNAKGLPEAVRVAGVVRASYQYDSLGRVLQTQDANGTIIETRDYTVSAENPTGNLRTVTRPGNRVTTYTYDAFGRLRRITAPGMLADSTVYDVLNRVTVKRTGSATISTTAYNALRVTSVTDAKGLVYGFTYNALGWLTQRTDPAGRVETYTYSVDGDLRTWTNRRGQTITYTYDALHRRTGKSGTNVTTETWSYPASPTQRWAVQSTPVAKDSISVNAQGQPIRTATSLGGRTYVQRVTYDSLGRMVGDTTTDAGGASFAQLAYTWSTAESYLTSITFGGAVTNFSYNTNGQNETRGNNYTLWGSLQTAYDLVNSQTPETTWRGMTFDSLGRISRQLRTSGTTSPYVLDRARLYSYDGLGHLATAREQTLDPGFFCDPDPANGYGCPGVATRWRTVGASTVTYTYDAVHNRTDNGAVYGAGGDGNRLTGFANCTYTYDADGNVTGRSGSGCTAATFTWTADNRLASATTGGVTTTYSYDAGGRLVRTVAGSTTRLFLWRGDHLRAELTGTGTTLVAEYSYLPGMDRLHQLRTPTKAFEAAADGLGNTIALSEVGVGGAARTYQYADYGALTGGSDPAGLNGADRARWKGALLLSPGAGVELYYMRHRWYEPRTGRFLSEDPIGLEGGINVFAYAAGDPVNGSDPSGLMCVQGQSYKADGQRTKGVPDVELEVCEKNWGHWLAITPGLALAMHRGTGFGSRGEWGFGQSPFNGFAEWFPVSSVNETPREKHRRQMRENADFWKRFPDEDCRSTMATIAVGAIVGRLGADGVKQQIAAYGPGAVHASRQIQGAWGLGVIATLRDPQASLFDKAFAGIAALPFSGVLGTAHNAREFSAACAQ